MLADAFCEFVWKLFCCTGNSTLAGKANHDWTEEEGVAASAKQNLTSQSTNDGSASSCKKCTIYNFRFTVTRIKNLEKMNHENGVRPENISSSWMHPVGLEAQKHFLGQLMSMEMYRCMRPCVEVRAGRLKDRAVQPSATIMLWVNHAHYALSGTTCRDFVGSLLGGCVQGILRV